MILSEDCELKRILEIAENNSFTFDELQRKRKWGEWNYLYRIVRKSNLIKSDYLEEENNSQTNID